MLGIGRINMNPFFVIEVTGLRKRIFVNIEAVEQRQINFRECHLVLYASWLVLLWGFWWRLTLWVYISPTNRSR